MTKQQAIQFLILISCAGLYGCASEQSSQPQITSTVAATADQAAWQMYTKKAEDALAKGDKKGAESNYNLAIAEAEKLGTETPAVASSTANLADFYYVQGEGNKADDLYKRSLSVYEKNVGKQHTDLIKDLCGLGKVSILKKKYAEAVGYYERAQAILNGASLPPQQEVTAGLDMAKKLASVKK
jgi:tetratricopeptide (TPR) repeat protein